MVGSCPRFGQAIFVGITSIFFLHWSDNYLSWLSLFYLFQLSACVFFLCFITVTLQDLIHRYWQGILLTGAPGTGKTLLAKVRCLYILTNVFFLSCHGAFSHAYMNLSAPTVMGPWTLQSCLEVLSQYTCKHFALT